MHATLNPLAMAAISASYGSSIDVHVDPGGTMLGIEVGVYLFGQREQDLPKFAPARIADAD